MDRGAGIDRQEGPAPQREFHDLDRAGGPLGLSAGRAVTLSMRELGNSDT